MALGITRALARCRSIYRSSARNRTDTSSNNRKQRQGVASRLIKIRFDLACDRRSIRMNRAIVFLPRRVSPLSGLF